MKRLLAAGYPDIYQVAPVFRGGEAGRHHLPEFTLVEWYRHGFDLSDIIRDTLELVAVLFAGMDLDEPLIVDYTALFEKQLGIDAMSAESTMLADAMDADEDLRKSVGDDRDAWLDLAMATLIANRFDQDRLTVVQHYPASQASLARLNPEDHRVADRFEIYLGSVELANGFVELTDAEEQLQRFGNDRLKRRALGLPDMPVDDALIAALRSGLPACAGVALGLDRVLMIAVGHDRIEDVITFSPGLI